MPRGPSAPRTALQSNETAWIALTDLRILGEDDYVHLPELLRALQRATGATRNMRVILHRHATHELGLIDRPRQAGDVGAFEYDDGGHVAAFAIVSASDRPLARTPDVDRRTLDGAIIGSTNASLHVSDAAQAVGCAVALAAAMLKRAEPGWGWRVAEAFFARPLRAGNLEAKIETRLAGRYWKIGVFNQGVRMGYLMVAKVPPAGN